MVPQLGLRVKRAADRDGPPTPSTTS
jgi:hypothetical protein